MALKFDKILGELRESDAVSLDNVFTLHGIITQPSDFPETSAVQNAWLYVISGTVTDNDPTKTNTGDTFYTGEEIAWISAENYWEVIGTTNYLEFSTLSGRVDSIFTSVSPNSAKWNSGYTTTNSNSSIWSAGYTNVSSNSAKWNSVYTSTNSTSSAWNSDYTTTNSNSANWSTGYTNSLTISSNLNSHINSTGSSVHGLGTISTQNANNVDISGSITIPAGSSFNASNGNISFATSQISADWINTIEQYVTSAPQVSSTGIKGQKYYDSNYVYECIDVNTWVRYAAESSW